MNEENFIIEKLADNINKEDIEHLLNSLENKINEINEKQQGEKILGALKRARLLGLMLQDWWEGRYALPWRSAAAAGGALLYFLNPRGVIKEKLSRGWVLSDAAVISLCCHLINEDLRQFIRQSDLDPEKFGFDKYGVTTEKTSSHLPEDNGPKQ